MLLLFSLQMCAFSVSASLNVLAFLFVNVQLLVLVKRIFFFEHPYLQLFPVLLGWSVLEGVQCLQSQSKRLLILYGETLTS